MHLLKVFLFSCTSIGDEPISKIINQTASISVLCSQKDLVILLTTSTGCSPLCFGFDATTICARASTCSDSLIASDCEDATKATCNAARWSLGHRPAKTIERTRQAAPLHRIFAVVSANKNRWLVEHCAAHAKPPRSIGTVDPLSPSALHP